MSLSNEDGMIMPVAPMYGNGGGFGDFGGNGWWVILFLFALMGNWGNGFGGNGGGNGVLPYMMNQSTQDGVSRGFDTAAITNQLAGISSGITNGFAAAEVSACNRSIDAMNQRFADTQALTAGMNNIGMSLQNCCCENRAGLADLKYTVASENCADRQALNDGVRDILTAVNASNQRVLDQMCQDKIDAKNETISQLRSELMFARGQASQDVQTAAIQAGQRALANEVEQYVLPTPRPAYIVQNPNCCQQAYAGCGCGSF